MRGIGRLAWAVLLTAAVAGILPGGRARAAPDPAAQLAERFAPIVDLREQKKPPCDTRGEQFVPSPVELVLGRPEVTLRGPGPGHPVTKTAPTARDLFGLGKGWYLDFPGSPYHPGCRYARDAIRLGQGEPPTAYAHIVAQAGVPNRLALQYWFFYYFNQFNDLHEGDWEVVQLVFAAADAGQALGQTPISVGYSQHDGGERARWGDRKLRREGDRIVVFPASGSHANYYGPGLWLGRSASEGFGCDDTRAPSRRVPTAVRVVGTTASGADAPDAWLGFGGNWGERARGLFDSPSGASTQKKWVRPMDWDDKLRDSSVKVPAGGTFGPSVTGAFCDAVAAGSRVYARLTTSPYTVLALFGVLVLATFGMGRRTRWRPVVTEPIFQHRSCGQMLGAARRIYREHRRLMLGLGLLFVPAGLIGSGIQWLLFHLTPLDPLTDADGARGGVTVLLALLVGAAGNGVGVVLLAGATVIALREIEAGRRPTALSAYRALWSSVPRLLGAFVAAAAVCGLALLTVIGIPLTIWLVVRWLLFPQAGVTGRLGPIQSLRASRELVRGRWLRTAGFGGLVNAIGLILGPAFGIVLLFITSASLQVIDLVGSLVYVVVMPFVAIAMALYHADLTEARATQPVRRARGSFRRPAFRGPGAG